MSDMTVHVNGRRVPIEVARADIHAALSRQLSDAVAAGFGPAGLAWYAVASVHAYEVGIVAGYEKLQAIEVGAGIIAALSPMCGWARNLQDALTLAAKPSSTVTAYHTNAEKARAIRFDGHIGALSGPKVRAFQSCMADPHDNNLDVVVDTWMARAAGLEPKDLEHVGVRDLVVWSVTKLAGRTDLAPMQIQATIWLSVRAEADFKESEEL